MKTKPTKLSDIKRDWWSLDVSGEILGRVSTRIAEILIGKHKLYFVPHLDCGDYVVLTNVAKIAVTGKKPLQKIYYRHSGFPGGLRETRLEEQMEKDPRQVIISAVKGMLPKNKLRDQRLSRLKLFVGDTHTFADKPLKELSIKN